MRLSGGGDFLGFARLAVANYQGYYLRSGPWEASEFGRAPPLPRFFSTMRLVITFHRVPGANSRLPRALRARARYDGFSDTVFA